MIDLTTLDWKTLLIYIIFIWSARYAIPWLKQQAVTADAKAKKANVDKVSSILCHMQSFLCTVAGTIVEQRFPGLAQGVVSGQIKSESDVKQVLHSWGADLKTDVISYFQQQGIDLVKEVGEPAIDSLVAEAANKTSPFPGQETAPMVFQQRNALAILEHGVHDAHKYSIADCKACVPPCDACPLKIDTVEKGNSNAAATSLEADCRNSNRI